MDYKQENIQDLFNNDKCWDLSSFVACLHSILPSNLEDIDFVTIGMIDEKFLEQIKYTISLGTPIYFGKTLRHLRCVIFEEGSSREHEIFFKYNGPKSLKITSVNLPHSPLQDREYESIQELIVTFKLHISNLANYFNELESIDKFCTPVKSVKPNFKENSRRIMFDERISLHVEVTPNGMASNVHIVGQSAQMQSKLHECLLKWNHDEDIVENVLTIFDLLNFSESVNKSPLRKSQVLEDRATSSILLCGICLCGELPEPVGVPEPLCENPICGVYFHRTCLYQWLVVCAGGRPPALGVVNGSCPTCFQPIGCTEKP